MIYTLTLNPSLDREMTIDAFAFDQVLRAKTTRVDYGGKGLNVSRALATLGESSIALGLIGGATGETLAAGLEGLGIRSAFVRVEGETRTNISLVTEDHTHYIKVNAAGPEISSTEQNTLLQQIQSLARAGDWWVLAGSLPPGVPPTFYGEAIEVIQTAGAQAILDTENEPLRLGCASKPFLVKPNAVEANRLVGMPIQSAEQAGEALPAILALRPKYAIISIGSQGAVGSDGQGIYHAQPPVVAEHNPIGAGDALVAGVVWRLSQNDSFAASLRWGVACGTVAASLDGTAMGSREQVEHITAQIRVIEIGSIKLSGK